MNGASSVCPCPLHPRTRLAAARHGLTPRWTDSRVIPPADHGAFLGLARPPA
jgi:hypothetical protein